MKKLAAYVFTREPELMDASKFDILVACETSFLGMALADALHPAIEFKNLLPGLLEAFLSWARDR